MDYGFLHEEETAKEGEHGTEVEAKVSMTVMVMLETMCESVWAYALDGKGAASVEWLAQQVVDDIETVGLSKERIITKTDQEPSIVQLQQEVAKYRKEIGTAFENSRVGDSDSNGNNRTDHQRSERNDPYVQMPSGGENWNGHKVI